MPTEAASTRTQPLTRDIVIDTALALVELIDIDELSTRKLATELGVTPMAMYRHVRNKAELLDAVFDRFIEDAAVTECSATNDEEWIIAVFCKIRNELSRRPGILSMAGSNRVLRPGVMAIAEEILGALGRCGLDALGATRAFHGLFAHLLGVLSLELAARNREPSSKGEDEWMAGTFAGLELLSSDRYPRVVETAVVMAGFSDEDRFETGLRRILSGLIADQGKAS